MCAVFFCCLSWKKQNIIDLLGRWVDDSRVADRNHRFPTNGNWVFCSNIVVNITTSTFILSAKFGSYCSRTIKRLFSANYFCTRFQDAGEVHQITAKPFNSSLYFCSKVCSFLMINLILYINFNVTKKIFKTSIFSSDFLNWNCWLYN